MASKHEEKVSRSDSSSDEESEELESVSKALKRNKPKAASSSTSSANSKKRKQPEPAKDAGDDDDDDDEKTIGTEIQATFSIEDFDPLDFYGIKNLLTTYCEGADAGIGFSPSDLANVILEQNGITEDGAEAKEGGGKQEQPQTKKVGSVVVVENEDEVYGFMTVVDMQRFRIRSSIKAVLRYALSKAPASQKAEWTKALDLDKHRVGLLISERLTNLPEALGLHLTSITLEELSKSGMKFDYYLVITSCYRAGSEEESDGQAPKPKKPKLNALVDKTVYYYKLEDSILNDLATMRTSFRIVRNNDKNRWTFSMITQPRKLILLLPADRIPLFKAQVNQLLKEAQ